MNMSVSELLHKLATQQLSDLHTNNTYYLTSGRTLRIDGYDVCSYIVDGHVSFYDFDDQQIGDYQLDELVNVVYLVETSL